MNDMTSRRTRDSMRTIPIDVRRALRRSRNRARILLTLARLGEAFPADLARHTGLPLTRVQWALRGHLPQYCPRQSLRAMGLARALRTRSGIKLVITRRGAEVAEALADATLRRARRAARHVRGTKRKR